MELIDTHCHLNFEPLNSRLDEVLERAAAQAVRKIVVPAYDLHSWGAIADLGTRPGLYPAIGLHPWKAAEPLDLGELETRLRAASACAIGEIGLDFRIDHPGRARQLQVLGDQLGLARDLDLPVLLHCRGAFEEMLEMLDSFGGQLRGVVHAFSRGPELAQRFIEAGFHLGLGGALTRPGAERLRRAVMRIPLDSVVLETDAPSIGLEGIPPDEVEPRHVHRVAEHLAFLSDQPLDRVAAATSANAIQLLGLS